uniref:hypothetical protein n=1 Tax=Wolbachia endosymbiont (group A) of Bibio marci TaxID=2953987 RepID=UPI00222F26A0|nr:hypothetical protein [Wolbachia endosymbiont (group A) of Bibio marci]
MTLASSLYYAATWLELSFLDPSGLCCIATEKIWWLLTKFIINNHLTVEEKICHRK